VGVVEDGLVIRVAGWFISQRIFRFFVIINPCDFIRLFAMILFTATSFCAVGVIPLLLHWSKCPNEAGNTYVIVDDVMDLIDQSSSSV
jgi:hypothetical protein